MELCKQNVLVVDDEPTNLKVLNNILSDTYKLTFAKSGEEALRLIKKDKPDLILLDVMMPGMTGYEVCETLKGDPSYKSIPIIFVTALNDTEDEAKGLNLGAVDYIAKPVSPPVVRARVKTHLSLVDAEELKRTRLQVIQRLGRASEYKDNETGMHVMRMSHYSRIIALAYGYTEKEADNLFHAAPMHDIGKIGIPDSIMLKPGKLTEEEFEIMKKHPEIGAEILGESDSDLIELAKIVSMTHHEKWDGTGYPNQLKGTDIPRSGRIVALADVFDALTSVRPYKEAWSVEKAVEFIQAQKGKHFDPELVDLFIQQLDKVIEIKQRWKD
ncbi:two-component system response regulator [Colwellia sp. 4_MG-2023]|jgi:putative two-component system response regulator|uniref:response regulator n=1 Tax=unclassified Colwellia TaxID=196834 RepID=UPI001C099B8D|nr:MULTISPECIES: two-component system response regulator [unclassified Colwellia]MBU2923617.1 two-component system response regulator [Colwellia sp. C2M11]MDO6486183.1 two-component system response regulator [Colwellia sp. 6_MG-2023]MDO6505861.1 two-component system response regulator [Colwellia sp. 5_MG-2023]MDO6554542.1 two-component system response regulator [Colwellia sp. 4_MG-2023]MDO6652284.1 two-component system response regulator [Colwellia sp. 3_MG-2023]